MSPEVVFFTHTLEGGVGRVTTLLVDGFIKEGAEADIWTLESNASSHLSESIRIFSFNKKRARQVFFALLNKINENKPKVIISATYYTNIIAILASMLSRQRVKVIAVEHIAVKSEFENLNPLKRLLMRSLVSFFYRFASSIVTVSDESADILSSYCFLPRKKITTIYNPIISDDLYEKSNATATHPFFDSGFPVLLNVSRLDKQKDIQTLLKAFSIITKEVESRLIIVGEGPHREQLSELAKDLKISDQIDFAGFLKNPYPLFKKAKLFVLSSLYEGLPTVLVEALALRLPIVSTKCPSGPTEILGNGKYGILTPVQDEKSFAHAVLSFLKNNNIIQPADDGYLSRFTQKYSVGKYLSIINNLK